MLLTQIKCEEAIKVPQLEPNIIWWREWCGVKLSKKTTSYNGYESGIDVWSCDFQEYSSRRFSGIALAMENSQKHVSM